MTTVMFRCLAATACALMTTGVLVGCGSTQMGGAGSASAPDTASKIASGSPASSSATESVPTSMHPVAQHGTNYNACFGGDCEVAVSGPVTITLSDSPIDAGPFTVQKVSADSVEMHMALPAGPSLSATVKTGCTVAFYANNSSGLADTSCSGEPEDILGMYVKQTVTVEDISDSTAILKLTSE